MQWHTQAVKINTNLKYRIYFILPELSATNIVTCTYHLDDYAKVRYDIILGRNQLSSLLLNLELSDCGIEGYYRPS